MKNNLTLIVENVLKSISVDKKYKGYAIEESLIAFKYLKKCGLRNTIWWKSLIKLSMGFLKKVFFCKKIILEKNLKKDTYKIVVAINFSIADTRHSKILIDFVNEFPDKKDLLIVTNRRCVAEHCFRNDFSYVFFKTSMYNFNYGDLFAGYTIYESFIFKEYREYIDFLSALYIEVTPKVVMTTQDFLLPDFYFAKVANFNNIQTLTHQHGEIPNSEKSLYSVLFSDYFMCWGEVSKERLKRSIDEDKIKIVGTTKFNSIGIKNNFTEGDILITPTVLPLHQFKLVLNSILIEIKGFNRIIIKTHPSQDTKVIKEIINEICSVNEIVSNVKVVGSEKGLIELLDNAFIMINIKSGAYLEGVLSGTSLIDLDLDGDNSSLFQNADSFIKVSDLKNEILKRKFDSKYNFSIIRDQKLLLKNNIFSTNLETEIEFVKGLL
ncbi:hypothetical protein [Flavobacterium sp. WC2429]|uniref:CDP-glycerol--glycerophosphate glycerophosphotransferase n=1 Tax=Flavobacterium sp. WC2429 TaxID=3234140 RepID=A0AB39WLM3_9FLAO